MSNHLSRTGAPNNLAHYAQLAILKDGTSILVRAIVPSDKLLLAEHFARLGPDSIRHRFFGAKKELSEKDLAYFTEVDFTSHVAFAAILRQHHKDEMIGVGRYCQAPNTTRAEVAFAVVDAHQGRGVGTILLEHLARAARANGIDELDAEVMADNTQMMHVFSDSGFAVSESMNDCVYHVRFPTRETASFLRASAARHQVVAKEQTPSMLPPAS